MALLGFAVVTLAFMFFVMRASAAWQVHLLWRGFLVTAVWAFGVRIEHVAAVGKLLLSAVSGVL